MSDVFCIERCNRTLASAYETLIKSNYEESIYYLYRSAVIKEFEVLTDLCQIVMKKELLIFNLSAIGMRRFNYNDVFLNAERLGLLDHDQAIRWIEYRDNSGKSKCDYEHNMSDDIIRFIPTFINDVDHIINEIKRVINAKKNWK